MPSIDPDDRVLAAIRSEATGSGGDDLPDLAESALLRRIGAAARAARAEPLDLTEPPAEVWDRIAAALSGDDPSGRADAVRHGPPPPVPRSDAPRRDPLPGGDPSAAAGPVPLRPTGGDLRRPRHRFGRTPWVLGAAAAALVLVAVAVAAVALQAGNGRTVVTEVALDQLGELDAAGRAELLRVGEGDYRLRLHDQGLDRRDGEFYEVWLIDPESDLTRMVSLGPLNPDGLYVVPPGIDPAQYRVVDVSIEPVDGEPTHSGNSVLRGVLEV